MVDKAQSLLHVARASQKQGGAGGSDSEEELERLICFELAAWDDSEEISADLAKRLIKLIRGQKAKKEI